MLTEFKEPEYGWPQYSDFYITVIACVVSWAIQIVMNKYTWKFFYSNCKEKNNEQVRLSKTQKSCDHFYKGFYFIVATVWGFVMMKDSDFLPPYLFGKGDLSRSYENYPLINWPAGLRVYYMSTMGYHLHMLLHHMMDHVRHDYMEMMLHHLVTLFLYGFSYLTNMTLSGAAVVYLHDIADVFTQYVRCFCETTFETATIFSVVGMTITWFYTRILVLPFVIYKVCFAIGDIYHGRNFYSLSFFSVHLCILYVLHIYWFGLLLRALSKFLSGGKLQEASDGQKKER